VTPPKSRYAGGGSGMVAAAGGPEVLRGFFGVFRYSRRAIDLVWSTNRALFVGLALLTVAAGLLPAAVPWIAAQIIDAVLAARNLATLGAARVLRLVLIEAVLVAALAGTQRGLSLCQALLRAQLGQRVNVMILEKALTLELQQFEDSEFYDKLTRARREASSRPLSLVMRTFGLVQNAISLLSYAALLVRFSPWTVLILLMAGLPAFIAEAKFSGDAFRLFRWRSPETRMQTYLETVLAREDHAKEVKLFGLGPRLLQRYRDIFTRLYREDRALSIRRDGWGFALGLLATATLYGAYAWIALATIRALISIGQMTLYVSLFRQGQAAVTSMLSAVGGMYEDNLYLSTLYEYLETPVAPLSGSALYGPNREDGVRFERVSFTYPGASSPALIDIDLHLPPGASLALVGRKRFGQDHADQTADTAVQSGFRPRAARRPAVARMAGRCPQGAHWCHLSGLHSLPDAGGRECRCRR
jgi:ATP-binding cassette subfamily B protein